LAGAQDDGGKVCNEEPCSQARLDLSTCSKRTIRGNPELGKLRFEQFFDKFSKLHVQLRVVQLAL